MSAKMSQILGIRGFLRTWWAGTGAQPGPALDHTSVEDGGGCILGAVICSGIVPGIEPIALLVIVEPLRSHWSDLCVNRNASHSHAALVSAPFTDEGETQQNKRTPCVEVVRSDTAPWYDRPDAHRRGLTLQLCGLSLGRPRPRRWGGDEAVAGYSTQGRSALLASLAHARQDAAAQGYGRLGGSDDEQDAHNRRGERNEDTLGSVSREQRRQEHHAEQH